MMGTLRQRGTQREIVRLREQLAMLEKGTRFDEELNEQITAARKRLEAAERLAEKSLAAA